jgi:hypothetical protein
MGRKGIGRRKKSGTQGSSNPAMRRQLIPPDEVKELTVMNMVVLLTRV